MKEEQIKINFRHMKDELLNGLKALYVSMVIMSAIIPASILIAHVTILIIN